MVDISEFMEMSEYFGIGYTTLEGNRNKTLG